MVELIFRLLFAWTIHRFLWTRPLTSASITYPVGLARLIPLSPFAKGWKYAQIFVQIGLLIYILGFVQQALLVAIFLLSLLYQTLACSQGSIRHDTQALVIVLGVLAAEPLLGSDWTRILCQQTLVAVYFTAGLSKVLRSGLSWVLTAPNLGLQMMKSTAQFYHTGHKSDLRPKAERWAHLAGRNPRLMRLALALGLTLELTSPLLLIAPQALALFLLSFHILIWRLMRLEFNSLVWLILLFLVELPHHLSSLIFHSLQ